MKVCCWCHNELKLKLADAALHDLNLAVRAVRSRLESHELLRGNNVYNKLASTATSMLQT